jgi:hypothetical protein
MGQMEEDTFIAKAHNRAYRTFVRHTRLVNSFYLNLIEFNMWSRYQISLQMWS